MLSAIRCAGSANAPLATIHSEPRSRLIHPQNRSHQHIEPIHATGEICRLGIRPGRKAKKDEKSGYIGDGGENNAPGDGGVYGQPV